VTIELAGLLAQKGLMLPAAGGDEFERFLQVLEADAHAHAYQISEDSAMTFFPPLAACLKSPSKTFKHFYKAFST
jgi:hypothetical protein